MLLMSLDINDCQSESCQNNGTCRDLVNDYRCDCVAGFNGTNCDNSTNMKSCSSSLFFIQLIFMYEVGKCPNHMSETLPLLRHCRDPMES